MIADDIAALKRLEGAGETDAYLAGAIALAERHPGDVPLRAFLALAQHSAGAHAAAMATMIDALPIGAPGDYDRALAHYRDELSASAP